MRFQQHRNFPQSEEDSQGNPVPNTGLEELIRAFQQAAGSEAQARAIADKLMAQLTWCPLPADVHVAALELQPKAPDVPEWGGFSPVHCRVCQDTGFESFQNRDGIYFSKHCRCRKGAA